MNINEYIAGAVGGVFGIIVGHPFDTAKIQMQIRTQGDHKIGRAREAWNNVKAQGLKRGMFRGMMFPVMSYGVVNSTFFGVYGSVIRLLEPDYSVRPTSLQVYWAGCFSGTVQLFMSCPVEVVKCTLQSQIPMKTLQRLHRTPSPVTGAPGLSLKPIRPQKYYTGPIDCIQDIARKQGIRGFYKGFNTMFVRDVPTYGLYLLVYEVMYPFLINHGLSDSNGIVSSIVAGGCAGSASWVVAMPFDVIKSRLQIDHGGRYKGLVDCFVQSVKRAGVSVLFRGTGITVVRAFPVNAVTFLVYSQLVRQLNVINPPWDDDDDDDDYYDDDWDDDDDFGDDFSSHDSPPPNSEEYEHEYDPFSSPHRHGSHYGRRDEMIEPPARDVSGPSRTASDQRRRAYKRLSQLEDFSHRNASK